LSVPFQGWSIFHFVRLHNPADTLFLYLLLLIIAFVGGFDCSHPQQMWQRLGIFVIGFLAGADQLVVLLK
jgi:hypothetical protein